MRAQLKPDPTKQMLTTADAPAKQTRAIVHICPRNHRTGAASRRRLPVAGRGLIDRTGPAQALQRAPMRSKIFPPIS
jgi:hypothetical protein